MITASSLESAGAFLAIVGPLMAVPLTAITFYLRSLREQQMSRHAELLRRAESIEASVADLRRMFNEFERDYTTKEEWLRECMLARRTLEQLSETTVRLETMLQSVIPNEYRPGAPWHAQADHAKTARTGASTVGRRGKDDR